MASTLLFEVVGASLDSDGNGYFVDLLYRSTDTSSITARVLGRF